MPHKTFKDKMSSDNVEKRMYSFRNFLNQIVASKELIYSPELVDFLSVSGDFEKKKNVRENFKKATEMRRMIPLAEKFVKKGGDSMNITEVSSVTGKIELKMDSSIRKMSRELERLLNSLNPLETEASEICRDMIQNMQKVGDGFDQLALVCAKIHKKYEKVAEKFSFDHFGKISDLYLSLNNTMVRWGKNFTEESKNYFENIRMMFDFSLSEIEGLDQVKKN